MHQRHSVYRMSTLKFANFNSWSPNMLHSSRDDRLILWGSAWAGCTASLSASVTQDISVHYGWHIFICLLMSFVFCCRQPLIGLVCMCLDWRLRSVYVTATRFLIGLHGDTKLLVCSREHTCSDKIPPTQRAESGSHIKLARGCKDTLKTANKTERFKSVDGRDDVFFVFCPRISGFFFLKMQLESIICGWMTDVSSLH